MQSSPVIQTAALFLSGLIVLEGQVRANDGLIAKRVARKVEQREGKTDETAPFRRGSAQRLRAVMVQDIAVLAEHSENLPLRFVALRWVLQQYLDEQARFSPPANTFGR